MEKTPRYTQRERNMVLGFAAQYKDVIENKRTDAESNRKKDEVWRVIAKEFNLRVYHQRSAKQLRQLYKNMKLLLKKDLCNDGKNSKSFMDILEALSQQESINQYLSSNGSPSGTPYSGRQPSKIEFDVDTKMASTFDNDVIVIKSEDISDNDQSSSVHNGDMDDDDDCLSTKDIPEVCLEEEDEEIFSRPPTQSTPDAHLMMRNMHNGGRKTNTNHLHGNGHSSSPSNHIPPECASNKNEFLLNLAIEERKRKIDLLNAQIEYWKTLTRKLEVTGSACGQHSSCTTTCHCHLPKMNGHNQS